MPSLAGSKGVKLRHLGLTTPHFHNLTELVLDDFASGSEAVVMSSSRRRGGGPGKLQLSNAADPGSNLALFQVTGELPLVVDFVFTGSLAPRDAQASMEASRQAGLLALGGFWNSHHAVSLVAAKHVSWQGALSSCQACVVQPPPGAKPWWKDSSLLRRPVHHCVPLLVQQVAKETLTQRFEALSGKSNACLACLSRIVARWATFVRLHKGLNFRLAHWYLVHLLKATCVQARLSLGSCRRVRQHLRSASKRSLVVMKTRAACTRVGRLLLCEMHACCSGCSLAISKLLCKGDGGS